MSAASRVKARVYKIVELPNGIQRIVYDTKLDRFLLARAIPPRHLAVASGYSRQHLLRLRGGADPTAICIRKLTAACIAICGDPKIHPTDLFDLVPTADEIEVARESDRRSLGPERRRDIAATGHTYRRR